MRITKVLFSALIISVSMASTVFAGEWKQEADGRYWYQNDDGSYPVNQWQEIDGKQYYFDAGGYMLANTTAPDGSLIGADGAKITLHTVSNVSYSPNSVTNALLIQDWRYEDYGTTLHFLEVTNNSPYTLSISINEIAKDAAGNAIGAGATSEDDIPAGTTVFLTNYFGSVAGVHSFDTSIETTVSSYCIPVIQNVAVEATDLGDKVLVKATNNGGIPVEFVEATVVFFKGNEVVAYDTNYFCDSESELKPGVSMTKQMNYYNWDGVRYDSFKVHVTGQRYDWGF